MTAAEQRVGLRESRYLTFVMLYGTRIYWAFGATLVASAILLVVFSTPAISGAYTGALIEYVYGIAIFATVRRSAT